jgi:hypothetical protein
VHTSAIIMWQSNVPLPPGYFGRATCERILETMGAPKVMFGTKCPSMTSRWTQSHPLSTTPEQTGPRLAKSALRMEGDMIAGGAIMAEVSQRKLCR